MKAFFISRSKINEVKEEIHTIEELKKITENLDFAQQVANIGSWHYDILKDQPFWSKQMFHIFGLSFDEMPATKKELFSLVHADDVDRLKKFFKEFLVKRESDKISYRIVRPDGECRHIVQKVQFLEDETGTPVKLFGTIQDITNSREEEIQAQQYKSLFDYNPDAVYSFDLEGNFVDCNPALLRLLGYTKQEIVKTPFLNLIEPESRDEAFFRFEEARKGHSQRYELLARTKSGTVISLSAAKFPIIVNEEVVGVYGIAKDVTKEKQSQQLLIEAEEKFRSMVEDSIAGAYIIKDGKFVYANPQAKKILGVPEMEGLPFWKVIHPDDKKIVEEKINKRLLHGELQNYEVRAIKGDGSVIHIEIHGSRSIINNTVSLLGTFMDITQKKRAADRNEYLAYHDHLTSLPNRRLLEEKLEQQIAFSKTANEQFAVLYLDLDRFKYINDTLGHHIGDQFLKDVAKRLKAAIRKQDFLAHIAGDEFVLFFPNVAKNTAVDLAKTLISGLEQPFYRSDYELHITASIGVSMYPEDGAEKETLMRKADSALYRAKALGKNNVQVYSPLWSVQTSRLQALEKDLRKAIENKEFELYYQPKVNLKKEIVGAEALIRWQHPKWGMISPADFIPLAEKMGLIRITERWVTETVCEQMKTWQQEGFQPIPVSINVSALRLMDKDFVDHVHECILLAQLDPRCLEVEITETSFLENEEIIMDTFTKLKKIGLQISLDDFGRGYSSLSYLKRFKGFIDTLKIDRNFIQDLDHNFEELVITETIIQLAERLKIKVVAEGVETKKQFDLLAKSNCGAIQGYLFSKPVPPAMFEKLLQKGILEITHTENKK